jgi:hypothetical protein
VDNWGVSILFDCFKENAGRPEKYRLMIDYKYQEKKEIY